MKKMLAVLVGIITIMSIFLSLNVKNENKAEALLGSSPGQPTVTFEELNSDLEQKIKDSKGWLKKENQEEEVYSLVTFNEKKSLDNAMKFAKGKGLEVVSWNHMVDVGDVTMSGGYFVGSEESLDEAQVHYEDRLKSNFSAEIDELKALEGDSSLPKEARLSAEKKRKSMETFLADFSQNEQVDMIYGLKVKGKVKEIKSLVDSKQLKAALKSDRNSSESPLYPEIPKNWDKGDKK